LQNLDSTHNAVVHRCVLERERETLNTVSHLGDMQSAHCGGPAWQKTCKQRTASVLEWYDIHRA